MANSSFFKNTGTSTQLQGSASASAAAALASEQAALASENASATSETNAAASAAAALASKNAAASSAASANSDASAAATSATTSQTAATSSSANAASTSADATQTAADRIQTGLDRVATNSDVVQTAADRVQTGLDVTSSSNSAAAALSSRNAAATSETNAAASAASSSADATATASDRVQTGLDAASTAADAIATAADRVQTGLDVTAAGTSASNAATSASAAASDATAAAASAASAANSYDLFDDRYLGSKTGYATAQTGPALDNDGNALVAGTLFFSADANEMRVYDGAGWIAASSAGSSSLINYHYTATAAQTTFSGSDDNSNTLSYTVDNLIVTKNGIVLETGTDYTATNGTSVVLAVAAAAGDEINVVAFKSFTTADMVSATNGGTFQSNVTVNGTMTATAFSGDGSALTGITIPTLSSLGIANHDQLTVDGSGNVDVTGTVTADELYIQSTSNDSTVNTIQLAPSTTTNVQGGLGVKSGGIIDVNGNVSVGLQVGGTRFVNVVSGGDISFYDSTGVTQGFFWDASTQRLGLGTTSPTSQLSFGANIGRDFAVFEGAGGANKYGIGMSGDGSGGDPFRTKIYANGVENVSITSSGNVGIGGIPAHKLDIIGNGSQLNFNDSNSRITFAGNRALEGNTAGTSLQVGEGYTDIALQGRVTMPYQPAFSAFNLATGSQYPSSYNTWATFDSNLTNFDSPRYAAEVNVGSHFSTSNGRFTAPVAGQYQISINVAMWVGNTSYLTIFKNGQYNSPYQLVYNADLGAYQNMTMNRVMTLAAGDYIQPGFYASSGSYATYIPGGGYIQFSGYLIG